MTGKHLTRGGAGRAVKREKGIERPADAAAQAPATRSSYHHGSVPDEALAVARAMVVEQGQAAVTMREVARALDVVPSALYRHYEDRAHLLGAVANAVHEELLAGLRALCASPLDARAAMAAASWHFLDFARAQPALFRMMYDEEVIGHAKAAQWLPALQATHAELLAMAARAWPRLSAVALRERLIAYWSTLFGHAAVCTRGLLLAYMVEGASADAITAHVVAAALGAFERERGDDAAPDRR